MDISLARTDQLQEIFAIFRQCKAHMEKEHIFQWTDSYPTLEILDADIKSGNLYCLGSGVCAGVIHISDIQEAEYGSVKWQHTTGNVLVIHRLAIDPLFQKQGLARKLMDFAEHYGSQNNYASVRLDAFSQNHRVLRFYENRGYSKRGEVYFPGRTDPFFCYEKQLTPL